MTSFRPLRKTTRALGLDTSSRKGEAYVVRADGRLENAEDIGNVILGSRRGVPIHLKEVAEVGIGRELRTGSASTNGNEVVVGTALMLLGCKQPHCCGGSR